jgi:hypothetical protein
LGRYDFEWAEHGYTPSLGAALKAAMVTEPGYHLGIQRGLLTPDKLWASNRTIEYVAEHPELEWCSSMILHCAGMAGSLGEFFEALRGKNISFVSHGGMAEMRPWLGMFRHVVIPASNCWRERAEIEPRILDACRAPGVVLFSCAMPSRVWIRKAWLAGGEATLIDIGAVFDPYIGRLSRSYIREGKCKLAERLY